jgi:hypothetical protein
MAKITITFEDVQDGNPGDVQVQGGGEVPQDGLPPDLWTPAQQMAGRCLMFARAVGGDQELLGQLAATLEGLTQDVGQAPAGSDLLGLGRRGQV